MSYRILIVDDEFLMLHNLQFLTDWEKHGYQIIGQAANGKEAMDFIQKQSVDIVLTDVYMPVMDGIALTKRLHVDYPEIRVLIMSSYSDFQYVRESFKNGAEDYILKHTITEQSLLEMLDKIREKLQAGPKVQFVQESREDTQDIRLRERIMGGTDMPESCILAVMRLQKPGIAEQVLNNIGNILSQMPSAELQESRIIRMEPGFVFFMRGRSREQADAFMEQARSAVQKFFNLQVDTGLCDGLDGQRTLGELYRGAMEEISGRNAPQNGQVWAGDTVLPLTWEQELSSAVAAMDQERTQQCLTEIFTDYGRADFWPEMLIGELITVATKICTDLEINDRLLFSCIGKGNIMMRGEKHRHEIMAWANELFGTMIELYRRRQEQNEYSPYVKLAIDYMKAHYMDNIMLKDIAASIGITEQYLSKVFKTETGENVSNYLTDLKIERAKQLIIEGKTNMKQLYSDAGFNSYNYFFTAFKKIVGCTPAEFGKKKGDK